MLTVLIIFLAELIYLCRFLYNYWGGKHQQALCLPLHLPLQGTAGWIVLASGALNRLTQVGFIKVGSTGSVPARAASPSQVCEETPQCITNNLSPDPYPDTLTISSTDEANRLYPELMGDYDKSQGLFRNGRPVWKHTKSKAEFYYDHFSEDNYWIVESGIVKISSEDSLLEEIPTGRWIYYYNRQTRWIIDATLTVQGG